MQLDSKSKMKQTREDEEREMIPPADAPKLPPQEPIEPPPPTTSAFSPPAAPEQGLSSLHDSSADAGDMQLPKLVLGEVEVPCSLSMVGTSSSSAQHFKDTIISTIFKGCMSGYPSERPLYRLWGGKKQYFVALLRAFFDAHAPARLKEVDALALRCANATPKQLGDILGDMATVHGVDNWPQPSLPVSGRSFANAKCSQTTHLSFPKQEFFNLDPDRDNVPRFEVNPALSPYSWGGTSTFLQVDRSPGQPQIVMNAPYGFPSGLVYRKGASIVFSLPPSCHLHTNQLPTLQPFPWQHPPGRGFSFVDTGAPLKSRRQSTGSGHDGFAGCTTLPARGASSSSG